ncbi:carbon storage regulator [Pseudomonas oryzihabitans]|uniref:SRNA-binding carbon storage regulator CsrA n=1 Tax=Pseudomonas oryzihabitans TaxID=47885 RepID=A0AAJ2BH64_9PSED|nr:carbon storage regulator [Pseudomonas psychrotolerans]MDR6232565.1 sRNA-binding carbon storage regulator CsrA [Pseudomonas psychrotolerans]MDR6679969.1 sRNA-binding carbon storage regulator CsrA [Pseudomonas psychrotolerans]
MSYLVLTRRTNEIINLSLKPGADEEQVLDQLFNGGINIRIIKVQGERVQVGIQAPADISIMRQELLPF